MNDDEFSALQQKARGAKELLESEYWQTAFAETEAAIIADWRTSAWDAPAEREQKFAEIKAMGLVRDRLQRWINDAKFEHDAREKRRALRA